jgi:hypothetical protein
MSCNPCNFYQPPFGRCGNGPQQHPFMEYIHNSIRSEVMKRYGQQSQHKISKIDQKSQDSFIVTIQVTRLDGIILSKSFLVEVSNSNDSNPPTPQPTPQQMPSTPQQMYPTPQQMYPTPQQMYPTPQQMTSTPQQMPSTPQQMYPTPQQMTSTPQQMYPTPQQMTSKPQQMTSTPQQMYPTPQQMPSTPQQMPSTPQQMYPTPQQMYPTPQQMTSGPVVSPDYLQKQVDRVGSAAQKNSLYGSTFDNQQKGKPVTSAGWMQQTQADMKKSFLDAYTGKTSKGLNSSLQSYGEAQKMTSSVPQSFTPAAKQMTSFPPQHY